MARKALLGIDISSTSVRVVRSEGFDKEGSLIITGVAAVPLPDGAVHAGRILSTGTTGAAVRQAVESIKASKVPAVIGVSDPDATTAQLRMPRSIPANKRISFLRTKGTRIVDAVMTSEGSISTYYRGDTVDRDGNELATIMAAVAPESEVDKIRTIAKVAGVSIERIDLSAAALTRAIIRDYASSSAVRAVVDIGATTTRVVVVDGLHVQEVRTILSGGADLTSAISAAAGSSIHEAEASKWAHRLPEAAASIAPSYGADEFSDILDESPQAQDRELSALSDATDDLIEQISQALSVSGGSSAIEGLFVVGGTTLLAGFLPRLHRRTGIAPVIAAPWAVAKENKYTGPLFMGASNGRVNDRMMLSFITACGLATPISEGGK